MTNTVTKKLAIALLTMVMLVSLMVGGTYAYFTDSVSIDGNIITAGDIEVGAKLYEEGNTPCAYDVELTKITLDNFAPGDSKQYMLTDSTFDGFGCAIYQRGTSDFDITGCTFVFNVERPESTSNNFMCDTTGIGYTVDSSNAVYTSDGQQAILQAMARLL